MGKIARFIKKSLTPLLPGHHPDFLIIGAQKAGTTSLFFYLDQHPQLVGSTQKEINFFCRQDIYKNGINWYHSHFKNIKNPLGNYKYFEATPEYLYRSFSAKLIHDYNPNLKLIVLLRDPVKRAYSAWNMYRFIKESGMKFPDGFYKGYFDDRDNNIMSLYKTNEFPTFEQCVENEISIVQNHPSAFSANYELPANYQEEPSFVRRGIYLPQVKRFVDLFGWDRIKIYGMKDLDIKQKDVLNDILKFTGLPENDWSFLSDEKKHVREYSAPMNPATETRLRDFYKKYNEELFEYLKVGVNW